ncbi:CD63 antigen-like [Cottoperca gobio]|uniref:CD63 antigen-like n=1 Tax=Cottoperca gobio TaxID=56716 RepID=A0A6J2RT06_COTGO|nr:CD63 antigen-like [Cottoperca gobio]
MDIEKRHERVERDVKNGGEDTGSVSQARGLSPSPVCGGASGFLQLLHMSLEKLRGKSLVLVKRQEGTLNFRRGFLFFNFLFLASGITLITIGVQQHSTYAEMGEFAGKSLVKISIVLIAVGAIVILVSLLGDVGVFFNNHNIVTSFICILIVVIFLEILTGAVIYIFYNKLKYLDPDNQVVKGSMDYSNNARRVISEYRPEKRAAIDRVQEKYKCCGADGPSDWATSVGWANHDAVPESCCVGKGEGCGKDKDKVSSKGCLKIIKAILFKNLLWIGALCIVLGVVEGFGVFTGVGFCLAIKQKNYQSMS